ncbi:hypothetical protein BHS06_01240 [Myxococcus xanthus]|uniref:SitA6 family polymorphic toxin lipoprotein n=1 Tax=Myxococcus xanthus TaxID=34 RepID=UPI00112B73B4|nr:TIGR02269 family lipoprotein [Myxococcus xanthus]QDE87676.1 hypothetical protein BHS06_01240 [Myxococcus xanthus]
MDSKRALVAWLLALVFTGCGHTAQKSQHAWEQVPHGEGESCTRVDRCVAEHLAKWFARSPRALNVHDFTLVIARDTHQRIHSGTRGGAWNQEWTDFARRYPGASQQQVWEHLGKLVQKYDLIGPIVPYYYLR